MTRLLVGIAASLPLLVCTARGAQAQRAAWPSVGAHLVRIEEGAVSQAAMPTPGGAAVVTRDPCAAKLRDPRTGREYMLRHSTKQEQVQSRQSGAATITTTELKHAVGDYARIEPKGDTLSTRVVTVDCMTSRVRSPLGAR
jgi:hypothetical protein